MGWWIKCSNNCDETGTWAENIVDLLQSKTDSDGWFRCKFGARGYIPKSF